MVVALLVKRLRFGTHQPSLPPDCGNLIGFSPHKPGHGVDPAGFQMQQKVPLMLTLDP